MTDAPANDNNNCKLSMSELNVTEKDQVFQIHGIYGRPIPAIMM